MIQSQKIKDNWIMTECFWAIGRQIKTVSQKKEIINSNLIRVVGDMLKM